MKHFTPVGYLVNYNKMPQTVHPIGNLFTKNNKRMFWFYGNNNKKVLATFNGNGWIA